MLPCRIANARWKPLAIQHINSYPCVAVWDIPQGYTPGVWCKRPTPGDASIRLLIVILNLVKRITTWSLDEVVLHPIARDLIWCHFFFGRSARKRGFEIALCVWCRNGFGTFELWIRSVSFWPLLAREKSRDVRRIRWNLAGVDLQTAPFQHSCISGEQTNLMNFTEA